MPSTTEEKRPKVGTLFGHKRFSDKRHNYVKRKSGFWHQESERLEKQRRELEEKQRQDEETLAMSNVDAACRSERQRRPLCY